MHQHKIRLSSHVEDKYQRVFVFGPLYQLSTPNTSIYNVADRKLSLIATFKYQYACIFHVLIYKVENPGKNCIAITSVSSFLPFLNSLKLWRKMFNLSKLQISNFIL